MNKKSLSVALKKCVDLFEIPIDYYHKIGNNTKYLRCYRFRYNKNTTNKKIFVTKNSKSLIQKGVYNDLS